MITFIINQYIPKSYQNYLNSFDCIIPHENLIKNTAAFKKS